MTKAKELPILTPAIHTFEITGKYRSNEVRDVVFYAIQNMLNEKKYYRASDKNYSYKRKDGGLTITLTNSPQGEVKYIKLSGINLARIAGNPSRLALTNLDQDALDWLEDAFLNELDQLGLLEVEDKIKWTMSRLDITQDFYVKSDPSLIVKIIRYAGNVDPQGKGQEKHHDQHNEIRSCKFEKTKYDFSLYDKHQQLLNCAKKGYHVPSDDLECSKNLVRYEIQLKRPYLKEFERENDELSRRKFENHSLIHYFTRIGDEIPTILREAAEPFGKDAWYSASGARKAVQDSDLKEKTKVLVSEYIESLDDSEALANIPHKKKIMRALNDLGINPVIIPESILNDRQMVRFPCKSLYSRVQEL